MNNITLPTIQTADENFDVMGLCCTRIRLTEYFPIRYHDDDERIVSGEGE